MATLYRGGIPGDVGGISEAAAAVGEVMAWVDGIASGMVREARLSTSQGRYTDQHARDRGSSRQGGEVDRTLIERLRNPPDAITSGGILTAVSAIVTAAGGSLDGVRLIRLPSEGAYIAALGAEPTISSTSGAVRATLDRGARINPPGRQRVLVVLIPAGLGILAAVTDAVRATINAGHTFRVEEFTAP